MQYTGDTLRTLEGTQYIGVISRALGACHDKCGGIMSTRWEGCVQATGGIQGIHDGEGTSGAHRWMFMHWSSMILSMTFFTLI